MTYKKSNIHNQRLCDDCKKKPAFITQYGLPFVPRFKTGYFCIDCFFARMDYAEKNGKPMPLPKP